MPTYLGTVEFDAVYKGSTEIDAIYLGDTEVWAGYEDGSLVIEDDTLDVNGGGTVNLRVKLGARPRSDVTVALSETSSLISLGDDSLTFTPDNWDTYQSVVVTGIGNRQSINLPAANYQGRLSGVKTWFFGTNAPPIDAAFGSNRYLQYVIVGNDSTVVLHIDDEVNPGSGQPGGSDLSQAFETNGRVTVTIDSGETLVIDMNGQDTSEPYTGLTGTGVATVYNALSTAPATEEATFVLGDYVPGDATISLSASGPDEYAGVTDSATVMVN